jgi:hypothetical protein
MAAHRVQARAVAAGRDDAAGAEQLRALDADPADDAGRAEDEDGLPRLDVRARLERQPCGEAGDPERHGDAGVEPVGDGEGRAGVDRRVLGHRPERGRRAVEVDMPAVAEARDALQAGDERRLHRPVHAVGDEDVDRIEAGDDDLGDLEAVAVLGILEVAVLRRAPDLANNGCAHAGDSTPRRFPRGRSVMPTARGVVAATGAA